ncbi:indolepyruvate ferredoxin oxidoreductase subunit alpha [bacterium]|nr:indolepyruvate ferredoxin oxidoreductase subunit alpha [bacterium]
MAKAILSGNEAVARGAYEAGLAFAAGYPGTPSTEILENIAPYKQIQAQWSPNEKVAFEVAMGACFGGLRSLVAMKHVGLNVAADPLFTSSYVGVNGGFVIISADDPGMHSSQNEQDNRRYARFAKIPLLEPSDSQEAKDFVGHALQISERFDTPVLLRLTTRICHSKGVVTLGRRKRVARKPYVKDAPKRLVIPAHARVRHCVVERRLKDLQRFAEKTPLNSIEKGSSKLGVVTSGVAYQYVREVFPQATILKLGFTFPFPRRLARRFSGMVEKLYVVEELEPLLEEELVLMGIPVIGKERVPREGELNTEVVREAFLGTRRRRAVRKDIVPRPPVLCPGCPHTGLFYTLKRLKIGSMGDIGCYTLGAMPPLNAMDTCICMGASIGNALGLEKAMGREGAEKIVAVLGDSTFLHSGMTGLLDVVYNQGTTTVIILDNRTTAMTGHQQHPGTGRNLKGEPAPMVDLEAICRALGVKDVVVVDPHDLKATRKAVKEATRRRRPSVIIARRPCVMLPEFRVEGRPPKVDPAVCSACGLCLGLGCPAIVRQEDGRAQIQEFMCIGCGLCRQVCPKGAIG